MSDEFEITDRSFFLFGPRGVGKTTWLKNVLPEAVYFDLLDASLFLELSQNRNRPIFFYRTGAGSEMDFIIETRKRRQSTFAHIVCLEVKFVYVMDSVYRIDKAEIRDIVSDFINLPGVEIVHQISLKTVFSLWPERVPDYGDAIIASLGKDTKGASVATFDRKFRAKLKKLGLSVFLF